VIGGTLLRQIWWRTVSLLCGDRRYRRGLKLLKANLTPSQLTEFLTYRRFDVVGGISGRIYRIRLTGARNVEELDRKGQRIRRLCFFPEGELVAGDVVLAQKVALETFEAEALAIANTFPAKPLTAKMYDFSLWRRCFGASR
jgi:hypothetical protein